LRKWKKKKWLIFLVALIAIIIFLYYENNAIGTTKFEISSSKLPSGFDSYRIVHLSDLHSKEFGKDQSKLVNKIKKLKPDVIFVTGDLVDSSKYNEEVSLTLMREAVAIAPLYYVTGNHEWASGRYDSLEEELLKLDVHVMRNSYEDINLGEGLIRIVGVDDPTFTTNESYLDNAVVGEQIVNALQDPLRMDGITPVLSDPYTLLLSHRPELFSAYVKQKMDLTFSGHAHGGQIRLPFLGGLIAPNQGILPTFDGGKYVDGQSTMIVSRGLGNSIIPQRLFNRPEIVVVDLKPQSLEVR
jgi:predicted MPP superfamily phosphohydrolase